MIQHQSPSVQSTLTRIGQFSRFCSFTLLPENIKPKEIRIRSFRLQYYTRLLGSCSHSLTSTVLLLLLLIFLSAALKASIFPPSHHNLSKRRPLSTTTYNKYNIYNQGSGQVSYRRFNRSDQFIKVNLRTKFLFTNQSWSGPVSKFTSLPHHDLRKTAQNLSFFQNSSIIE